MSEIFRVDEANNAAPLLSNLEPLELSSLPDLRWIVKSPTHCVDLECLKVLEIISWEKLESLFSISIVRSLIVLEELKIVGSNELLKGVFMEVESNAESNTLYLPNLKNMEIKECPNLEYVFPLALARGFLRLQKLLLVKLGNLRGFAESNDVVKMVALKTLDRNTPAKN
ncbi:hypothetical protein Goshw_014588, partial [Gossypium schwendimanii]|nr:hypothetical protein [Gossypium schwendimanii]